MRRTVRKGIEVGPSPYERGYWARYDGDPRPRRAGEKRDGWDACDDELTTERSDAAFRGWETRRQRAEA